MKVSVEVNYNNAYKWYYKNGIYVIGYIYYNDQLLINDCFIDFVLDNFNNLDDILGKITGFFAIVIKRKNEIYMISDVMRTFPLFYQINDNQVIISDNIYIFQNVTLDNDCCDELINLRYVLGNNTIYKEVKQLSSNEIIVINDDMILKSEKYYNFNILNSELNNEKRLIEKIDSTFNEAIKKLIMYAKGRTLVIPLSGGYDSRQILLTLYQQKYKNIICYTYGKKIDGEVLISKRLAERLNYQWFFVKYNNSSLKKIYYNKHEYNNVISYISRGFSSPVIQEWYAIYYLNKNNFIPHDSIIVPGFTGDALAGSHLDESFFNKKSYTIDEITRKIVDYNYIAIKKYEDNINRLKNILNITRDTFSLEDAINYYNKYDFEERQVKYITNAVRIYEYYGYEWYLPFWDKEYINFWRSIKIKYKFNRNLLKKYFDVKHQEIMHSIPIYQKQKNKKTRNYVKKIYNILMLYYNDNMNLYGYYKYHKYLRQILFSKNVSYDYIFGKDYIFFVRKVKK